MAIIVKRGATVRVTMEFTEIEWAAIYPWESIKSEAQMGATGSPTFVEHEFDIVSDPVARTLKLSAPTTAWGFGSYQFDVRVEKGGESIFIPAETSLSISIVEGVTE